MKHVSVYNKLVSLSLWWQKRCTAKQSYGTLPIENGSEMNAS